MGNCKDCRYWTEAQMADDFGECYLISESAAWQNGHEPIAVIIPHGYDCESGELLTKADFGCVLFEQDMGQRLVKKAVMDAIAEHHRLVDEFLADPERVVSLKQELGIDEA